jgi:hypothetical protein
MCDVSNVEGLAVSLSFRSPLVPSPHPTKIRLAKNTALIKNLVRNFMTVIFNFCNVAKLMQNCPNLYA